MEIRAHAAIRHSGSTSQAGGDQRLLHRALEARLGFSLKWIDNPKVAEPPPPLKVLGEQHVRASGDRGFHNPLLSH